MGGNMDCWCFPSLDRRPCTMVLLGRTGNGKSATGNSILGRSAFESEMSLSGVTCNAECQTAMLTDGRVVNVIDTPGLCDFSVGSEFIRKEIMKCIELTKDGIHAVLFVLSLGRFTKEEEAVIQSLCTVFGPKMTDYMIVVFTGGDLLKKFNSLEDYLDSKCPKPLQRILKMCNNRIVLFDNMTTDEEKKTLQLQKLLSLIDKVIEENDGKLYSNLCTEFKEAAKLQQLKEEVNDHTKEELIKITEQIQKSQDEQLKMFESKLKETNEKLQQQLNEEKAARLNAEKIANEAQNQMKEEIQMLKRAKKKLNEEMEDELQMIKRNLNKAKKESEEYYNELKRRINWNS